MGINALNARSDGQKVQAADVNQYKTALSESIVGRNAAGVVEAGQNLGEQGIEFGNLYINGNIIQNNNVLDFSQIRSFKNAILSGKVTADLFPDFITPGGSASLTAVLDATSTPFSILVNGVNKEITSDINLSVSAGFTTNHTALVNDTTLTNQDFTKYIGEFIDVHFDIPIDTIGSNITSRDGQVHSFLINNGIDDELFMAKIDISNNSLLPLYRGLGGTKRITFDNNDVITLCNTTYFFIDVNENIFTTNVFPINVGKTLPSPGTNGLYIFRNFDQQWYFDNGASITQVDRIWIGCGVSSNATDNDYIVYFPNINDLKQNWFAENSVKIKIIDSKILKIKAGSTIDVAGSKMQFFADIDIDLSDSAYRDTGVTDDINTFYYPYVTHEGNLKFSYERPRNEGVKQGKYHPYKYWHYIGYTIGTNSSGDIYLLSNLKILDKTIRSSSFIIPIKSETNFFLCNASGGSFTATLPNVTESKNDSYTIYKDDNSSNSITITGAGLTVYLYAQDNYVNLRSNGTKWIINNSYTKKIINSGDWNMALASRITVPHGLSSNYKKILNVSTIIRRDDDVAYLLLSKKFEWTIWPSMQAGISTIDGTNIQYDRKQNGFYDSTDFNSTSFNRAIIEINLDLF